MLKPEQRDHIAIVEWFSYQYPELVKDFHHFANERKCSLQYGALLKRMGVQRGVADFFLGISCGGYHGLWIELKVGKGKLTTEQQDFLFRKTERGYKCVAVWGFDAAIAFIKEYLQYSPTNCLEIKPKNLYNGKPIC